MILPRKASGLSFVTPVAYDFNYALAAIAAYYPVADEVVLGLDSDRVSWSGARFDFDDLAFQRGLKAIDTAGKVKLVQADFHSQGGPQANDTYERNALARNCSDGFWIVQIDSDELLQNPDELRDWLMHRRGPWLAQAQSTTVFKVFGQDYLVVDKPESWVSIATRRRGVGTESRETKEWKRLSPGRLLHFDLGRGEAELVQKLAHYTHSKAYDTAKYLDFWRSVTLNNYHGIRDLHPLRGEEWPQLKLLRKGDPGWVAPPQ
jgi:hypothetical protein